MAWVVVKQIKGVRLVSYAANQVKLPLWLSTTSLRRVGEWKWVVRFMLRPLYH
jgi:hypothetical protein